MCWLLVEAFRVIRIYCCGQTASSSDECLVIERQPNIKIHSLHWLWLVCCVCESEFSVLFNSRSIYTLHSINVLAARSLTIYLRCFSIHRFGRNRSWVEYFMITFWHISVCSLTASDVLCVCVCIEQYCILSICERAWTASKSFTSHSIRLKSVHKKFESIERTFGVELVSLVSWSCAVIRVVVVYRLLGVCVYVSRTELRTESVFLEYLVANARLWL